jgi:hypothetical protein
VMAMMEEEWDITVLEHGGDGVQVDRVAAASKKRAREILAA